MAATLAVAFTTGCGAVGAVRDDLQAKLDRNLAGSSAAAPGTQEGVSGPGTSQQAPSPEPSTQSAPAVEPVVEYNVDDKLADRTNEVFITPPEAVRSLFGDLGVQLRQPNATGAQGYSYLAAGEFGLNCLVALTETVEPQTAAEQYTYVVESRFVDAPYFWDTVVDVPVSEAAAWLKSQLAPCSPA